jgi:hypothetical protein
MVSSFSDGAMALTYRYFDKLSEVPALSVFPGTSVTKFVAGKVVIKRLCPGIGEASRCRLQRPFSFIDRSSGGDEADRSASADQPTATGVVMGGA